MSIESAYIKRKEMIDKFVSDSTLIKLKSDYINDHTFYYNVINNIIYKVNNVISSPTDIFPSFEHVEDPHIRELNGI